MYAVQDLARIKLFADLEPDDLAEVGRAAQLRSFAPEDVVIREGELGEHVFLIISGTLRASVREASGRNVSLGTMGSGELFGEIAAVDGLPRSATVTTLTPADLLAFDRVSFLRLMRARPRFGMRVLSVMAHRLRERTQQQVQRPQ